MSSAQPKWRTGTQAEARVIAEMACKREWWIRARSCGRRARRRDSTPYRARTCDDGQCRAFIESTESSRCASLAHLRDSPHLPIFALLTPRTTAHSRLAHTRHGPAYVRDAREACPKRVCPSAVDDAAEAFHPTLGRYSVSESSGGSWRRDSREGRSPTHRLSVDQVLAATRRRLSAWIPIVRAMQSDPAAGARKKRIG